jgi:hypothetical protein
MKPDVTATVKPRSKRRFGGLALGLGAIVMLAGLMLATPLTAHASPNYLTAFKKAYPVAKYPKVKKISSCKLCHTTAPALNPYGSDFASHGHSFTAINNLDSDKDGSTNLAEIKAGTWPGIPGK